MRRGVSSWLGGVFLTGLLFSSSFLLAQKITGDIEGNVTDSSGAVVPNATVTVENPAIGLTRTTTSSNSGNYRINDLPIGTYKVTASAGGFKSAASSADVKAGALTHANFVMQVGQRTETVEVQGSAPLVELSPNENNYVDEQKIANLPLNGRDFNSLVATTPGVQRTPGGGFLAISINGSRTTSNNYFIDGLYNNDRYYGDSAINETGIVGIPAVLFPPEAIEELSVQETPSAEFGVKGGAPILLNMKSGTNAWHGSGTWVNHSGFGDAANYFANHQGCASPQPGQCQPTNIHNNQFNGTIGGPIIKDKAFFFLYYEGQRYKSVAVSSRPVPTPSEIQAAKADIALQGLTVDPVGAALLSYFPTDPTGFFIAGTPTTASANGFGVKFDYKLKSNHAISVRYLFGDSLQSAAPLFGLPAAAPNPSNMFNSVAPSRAQLAGVSWTWNMGNRVLESRLGYTRFAQLLGINNKVDPKSLGIDTGPLEHQDFGVPYVYMSHLGYGGYIGGVQGYPLITRPDATWDWSEHFSWVKGNHTIRLGGNFQRAYTNSTRNEARTGFALGYFSAYATINTGGSSPDLVQGDVEQLLLGKADLADRSFGNTHRHITQNSVGFYAQDDWKVKPRLTVNYGLRYDINGTIRDTNNIESNFIAGRGLVQVGQGISGIHNVDYADFGPHVGVAWDIFGTGKTALRAGYSLTYDVANFGAFASPYSFAHARTGVFTQSNLGFFNVSNSSGVGSGVPDGYTNNDPNQPFYYAPNNPLATCYNPATGAGDYICFNQAVNGPLFGTSPAGSPPFNAFSVVSDFKTPHYNNFNVSIQHELLRNNVLTVAYSGQRGGNLLIYRDLNASPLGSNCNSAGSCDSFRPFASTFPDFRHVIQATNGASSQYDSLQVSMNQRDWHGFDTQYNFTWSKCFDDNSVNRGGASSGNYPQINNDNPVGSTAPAHTNYANNRGLCDHDVRLNFNVGGVYSAPDIPHLGRFAGKGWQLSSIYTAISGRPFTVLLGGSTDPSGQGLIGNSIRAAYDGTPIHYNTRNPDAYVTETYTQPGQADPCGNTNGGNGGRPLSPFYVPCSGVGNSRRGMLIGPGLSQWDMSLIKNTKLTERFNVEFRWEVFNILNRGNFYYAPNNILTTAGFGQIKDTSDVAAGNPVIAQGGPRNMNFSLKLKF